MENSVIALQRVQFSWPGQDVPCLDIDRFEVARAGQVFVSGPSGSGKSTLLSLIGGVLVPQRGSVRVLDVELGELAAAQRDRFRVDHVGFIFQQFNLIPYLSILDNVLLPCRFSRRRRERSAMQGSTPDEAARGLLQRLDLDAALWQRPVTRLSVGQQQRVAVARALIGRPEIIVADEPTSALDASRQSAFLDLMRRECAAAQSSLLFVSHDQRLAEHFSHRLNLTELNHAVLSGETEA